MSVCTRVCLHSCMVWCVLCVCVCVPIFVWMCASYTRMPCFYINYVCVFEQYLFVCVVRFMCIPIYVSCVKCDMHIYTWNCVYVCRFLLCLCCGVSDKDMLILLLLDCSQLWTTNRSDGFEDERSGSVVSTWASAHSIQWFIDTYSWIIHIYCILCI